MFTIHDGKVYKVKEDKMVGVDITPTELKEVKGSETKAIITNLLTLAEIKIKYHIIHGESYKFPVEVKEKVDKDEPTTKTKKSSGKSK